MTSDTSHLYPLRSALFGRAGALSLAAGVETQVSH